MSCEGCPERARCLEVEHPQRCPLWRMLQSGAEVSDDSANEMENAERAWRSGHGRDELRPDRKELLERMNAKAREGTAVLVHNVGPVRLPDAE